MIKEAEYKAALEDREIAPSAIKTYLYALNRIEREEGIDIEEELARDQLASLIQKFTYTTKDQREGRPNPTRIAIDPKNVHRFLGWYRRHLERYRAFRLDGGSQAISDVGVEGLEGESIEEEETTRTFALEHDLQTALRLSLDQLEPGLKAADGGRECKVEAGFIDILAKDAKDQWVVIELKAENARPEALTQLLAYMGCVAKERGGPVRGILVAADFVPRLVHAVQVVPNISLKKYGYRFTFE